VNDLDGRGLMVEKGVEGQSGASFAGKEREMSE
jgi:hypothetical protein